MALKIGNTTEGKALPQEGIHEGASVKSIAEKGDRKLTITFVLQIGTEPYEVDADYPRKWQDGSELCKVAEAILARKLTVEEFQNFDLETLQGKKCRIVTTNVRGSGGRMKTAITAVLKNS